MAYSIEYPEDWIGIPHFGPGEVFATPEAWAEALAAEITAPLGMFSRKKERRAALADTLAFVAQELEKGGAHWGYAWLASVDGPLRFVAVRGLSRADIGDATGADLAGADGEGDYVPPIVREITTSSGAAGTYVERHSPMADDAPLVQVISGAYAFERPDGIVLMEASTADMAGYEAFRPQYEKFARTFRWDD